MMLKDLILLASLLGLAVCLPGTILDHEGEDHSHKQEGNPGEKVEGHYSWTSPEGVEYYVKYIADENGFRIVDSNAVPISSDGQLADGNQGSFSGEEGEGEGGEGQKAA